MFEALAQAVEELEVPADPCALTEVWALVDRLSAKATMAGRATPGRPGRAVRGAG